MDEWEELHKRLIHYVKTKFYSRPQISDVADDIVNGAFAEVLPHKDKCNFGYLSKVCIHIAYRFFKGIDNDSKSVQSLDNILGFINDSDVVDEIIQSQDTAEILASLDALKEIERVIILQRYYGDYSFAEIAKANNVKLNTVLSHHRRALEKLRPRLSMLGFGRTKQYTEIKRNEKSNFSILF